jgi:hypothetical protein
MKLCYRFIARFREDPCEKTPDELPIRQHVREAWNDCSLFGISLEWVDPAGALQCRACE